MISTRWTEEERKLVRRGIVDYILDIPVENVEARQELFIKLVYLDTQPAVFLETNRGEFLKYLPCS